MLESLAALTAALNLTPLGHLATLPAADIASSRFSIGVETLDRGMWELDPALPHLAALGAKWARVQTGWGRCETQRGVYDFGWLDATVDKLRAVGIEPWFNVGYGNQLYTPDAPHPTAVGWTPVREPEARAGWAAFCEALARHYAGRVRFYEVWNEPDIKPFWTPYDPSPADYAELVKLTAPALGRGDGAVKVVGGATAMALGHNGFEWVQGCFEAGMGEHIDAFSYHIYSPTPEPRYEPMQPTLRALVERYRPGLPLWQGESGAPSKAVPGQALAEYEFDEQRQAVWDARRALLDLSHGAALSAFFHIADFQFYIIKNEYVEREYYFGLLGGKAMRRKPAYSAAQSLCTLLAGEVSVDRSVNAVLQPGTDARTVAFATERGPLLAFWRAQDIMAPQPPAAGTLTVWLPTALRWREPVIIDPISQTVWSAPAQPGPHGTLKWTVPICDWPLLIGERGQVAIKP